MTRKQYHVTQRDDGKWQGKATDADRATAVGDTKKEVVARTTQTARKRGDSQVIIHKQDGTFQEERTYGNDPYPPKG